MLWPDSGPSSGRDDLDLVAMDLVVLGVSRAGSETESWSWTPGAGSLRLLGADLLSWSNLRLKANALMASKGTL